MNNFGAVILILAGVLLIVVSQPFAEYNVRQYNTTWSKRVFGPGYPSPKFLTWVFRLTGAAFCLAGADYIFHHLK